MPLIAMTCNAEPATNVIPSSSARRVLRRAGAILWRLRRGINKALVHKLLPYVAKTSSISPLERLGSYYGGWYVPTGIIRPDWICYCVGVGIDATFDLALVDRFGCHVVSLDPTPKAIEYMRKLNYDRSRLDFRPVGV